MPAVEFRQAGRFAAWNRPDHWQFYLFPKLANLPPHPRNSVREDLHLRVSPSASFFSFRLLFFSLCFKKNLFSFLFFFFCTSLLYFFYFSCSLLLLCFLSFLFNCSSFFFSFFLNFLLFSSLFFLFYVQLFPSFSCPSSFWRTYRAWFRTTSSW